MKKTVFRFLSAVLTVAVLLVLSICPVCAFSHADDISLDCEVDYLLRLNDGAVLIDNNASLQHAQASVTKITTALVVLQNCRDLQKKVTVDGDTLDLLLDTNSSLSAIVAGEELTVENLLRCMMIPSGNDAALVLADYVGGSVENFVDMMNECITQLGCTGTHYDNPHGLDSDTHYTTAQDIAVITKAAMEYDIFRSIVSTHEYTLPATNMQQERTLTSTNDLMSPDSWFYRSYVCGVKTGHTDDAGYCLVSFAEQNGTQYLAVALGGNYDDYNEAFYDTVKMFDWAFEHYSYMTLCTAGQTAFALPVQYGTDVVQCDLVFATDAASYIYDGDVQEGITVVPVDIPQSLTAPLSAGETVGLVQVYCNGTYITDVGVCVRQDVAFDRWAYIKDGHYGSLLLILVCTVVVCGVVILSAIVILKKKSASD